ncbi:hypothetical protein BaRGS_00010496 [Batillaria attramentaria]|uniref:Uncharacterized protein n=1 Tax=Batillaria attramentaria TaxID=370345 RepID=A0ABD0LFG0_9CAEN
MRGALISPRASPRAISVSSIPRRPSTLQASPVTRDPTRINSRPDLVKLGIYPRLPPDTSVWFENRANPFPSVFRRRRDHSLTTELRRKSSLHKKHESVR